MTFNRRELAEQALVFYQRDTFSYDQPKPYVLNRTQPHDYTEALLQFQFDETVGELIGLFWKREFEANPAWFGCGD